MFEPGNREPYRPNSYDQLDNYLNGDSRGTLPRDPVIAGCVHTVSAGLTVNPFSDSGVGHLGRTGTYRLGVTRVIHHEVSDDATFESVPPSSGYKTSSQDPKTHRECPFKLIGAIRDALALRAMVEQNSDDDDLSWMDHCRWLILWLYGRAFVYTPAHKPNGMYELNLERKEAMNRFGNKPHQFEHFGDRVSVMEPIARHNSRAG